MAGSGVRRTLSALALWRHEEAYRRNIFFLSGSRMISTLGTMVSYIALVAVTYDAATIRAAGSRLFSSRCSA